MVSLVIGSASSFIFSPVFNFFIGSAGTSSSFFIIALSTPCLSFTFDISASFLGFSVSLSSIFFIGSDIFIDLIGIFIAFIFIRSFIAFKFISGIDIPPSIAVFIASETSSLSSFTSFLSPCFFRIAFCNPAGNFFCAGVSPSSNSSSLASCLASTALKNFFFCSSDFKSPRELIPKSFIVALNLSL